MSDPEYGAAEDPTGEKARERAARREAGQQEKWNREVVAALMGTPQGRLWMDGLLAECGMYQAAYSVGRDALETVWRDGKRHIGHLLMAQIEAAGPDFYLRMIRERRERITRKVQRDENAQNPPA